VYGFPIPRACRIAVTEVRAFLASSPLPERVDLVCFDSAMHREYLEVLRAV
jgi:O-acetyl-ADP-ribose deacetylase (regulator of RNase III)